MACCPIARRSGCLVCLYMASITAIVLSVAAAAGLVLGLCHLLTRHKLRSTALDVDRPELHKRLDNLALYERVWRNMPIGAIVVNADGVILRCNPRFAQILTRDKASIVGQPFFALLVAEPGADTLRAWEDAKTHDRPLTSVFRNQYRNGHGEPVDLVWFTGSGPLLQDGVHVAFCMPAQEFDDAA